MTSPREMLDFILQVAKVQEVLRSSKLSEAEKVEWLYSPENESLVSEVEPEERTVEAFLRAVGVKIVAYREELERGERRSH